MYVLYGFWRVIDQISNIAVLNSRTKSSNRMGNKIVSQRPPLKSGNNLIRIVSVMVISMPKRGFTYTCKKTKKISLSGKPLHISIEIRVLKIPSKNSTRTIYQCIFHFSTLFFFFFFSYVEEYLQTCTFAP